ncbi:ephrin type-A receptor 4-A isoform X2 [Neocloeon triangulifer]|uniref:ephrin type-A receptor 4-A isoform X2 n=1 Tax=Neocloeon triangulifer TaxID=2078957 RepID=UPI00286FAADA|nr:ephrin type-A receptor 4-A isoform X2 [Neocloeon triangulifer]
MQTTGPLRVRRTTVIHPARKMALVFKTCIVYSILVLSARPTVADEVVLMDSTKMSPPLDWDTYSYSTPTTQGWLQETYNNFQRDITWQSFSVCDVAFDNVNNFLVTPFIQRGTANRLYVEIKFSIRDCKGFPNRARSCKETFSLLYYEFDVAASKPQPSLDDYKMVGKIAAREGNSHGTDAIINTEIRSIPVSKNGVYFAFRDQGGCISLLAFKVYYHTCPEVSVNFAKFPATPTSREATQVEQAKGVCVANSQFIDLNSAASGNSMSNTTAAATGPTYLCTGDGKWFLATGFCKCKAGFEPDFQQQKCIACQPGTYKADTDKVSCSPCPEHSTANKEGQRECKCNPGYHRLPNDPKSMPCTQPPTAPQNLTVIFVDQSTVSLAWEPPFFLGGRGDTVYRVVCDACGLGVSYNPSSETFNETRVTISGLNPVTTYRFQIFSENGVTVQSGEKDYADIRVTTEASVPSSVANVRATGVKSTEVSLAWDAPEDDLADIEMFEVRYFIRGEANNNASVQSVVTSDTAIPFTNLRQRTEYGFQVRAKTTHGWGEFSPPVFKTTGQVLGTPYVGEEDNVQMRILAGAIVGTVVVVVLVIVLVVLFFKSRGSDDCNKKQPSDCDTLEYRNGEVTTPLFTQVGASRTYIDPHTYEDPNQAVREFAREIDASCITIEAIIGGGEFGDVCRGKLRLAGRAESDVAIKTLKPGSSDKARMDFLTEASIMGQFEHPNVIFLQGVVTKSNPVMIITEYMENGSLDTFLRANDGQFQVLQLAGMLRGIAAGMQYLSEMNYVHRDLAARNVLVNAQLVCKIADFGLSREIESTTEGAYTTRGGKIPVRWTAPEAIAFRKFTSASDVWSFGIVCWEVMSYGERPYWNWSNQDVIKSIEKGYRLPAPMDCPEAVYQLMLDCWQKERTHRPTFASIVKTLDKLIRCPDTLRKIAQNRTANPLAADAPDMTQFTSVEEWLSSIKMARYMDNFQRAGICSMDAVVRLTVKELTALGITLVGHQKKIMNSVQAMRAQISANLSEGFLV